MKRSDKDDRRAAALRENLRKRKDQKKEQRAQEQPKNTPTGATDEHTGTD